MKLTEILKKLCAVPGVSGNESEIASAILEMIEDDCEPQMDALGNILVWKKGAQPAPEKILFHAHMDEVGLMVNGYTEHGSLRFTPIGNLDPRVLIGRQVQVGDDAIPGVIGGKPIHLQDAEERKTAVPADKLYIDIGCASKEEAEELVPLGETVTFLPEFAPFGEGLFRGKAIDSRFGCAVLIDMIRSELPYDCWFAFTVQEETTGIGAGTAAFGVKPDIAIAVETAAAADIPGVSAPDTVCELGKGAVLSFMDQGTLYPRRLYRACQQAASENQIPYQVKTASAGKNGSAAMQKSAGAQTASLCAPCRYIHTPQCVISDKDMKAVRALANAVLTGFCEHKTDKK